MKPPPSERGGGARGKQRLDVLLVERGLASTRARAQALVLAGRVIVGEHRHDKPGERVPVDVALTVKGDQEEWASRGAFKLLGALEAFPWLVERLAGADCLDVGASTGGFTDVMLRHGAARVFAVDVGYGQLHWRLRTDERVVVLDRTNIRHLTPDALPCAPTFATCDASFISSRLFMEAVAALLAPGAVYVLLVKPQFEVGREGVGRKGVVRDPRLRQQALDDVREAALQAGFVCMGHVESPIEGPEGNREILLVLEKTGPGVVPA
ncbi:MAG: TlyA family RNA methyltransferase [Deltaproteobacteria bacterium]|nr:TlyA family RNA methyltransferase [Deltaproteobacteria bacterium]